MKKNIVLLSVCLLYINLFSMMVPLKLTQIPCTNIKNVTDVPLKPFLYNNRLLCAQTLVKHTSTYSFEQEIQKHAAKESEINTILTPLKQGLALWPLNTYVTIKNSDVYNNLDNESKKMFLYNHADNCYQLDKKYTWNRQLQCEKIAKGLKIGMVASGCLTIFASCITLLATTPIPEADTLFEAVFYGFVLYGFSGTMFTAPLFLFLVSNTPDTISRYKMLKPGSLKLYGKGMQKNADEL